MNIEAISAENLSSHLSRLDERQDLIENLLRKLALSMLELNRKVSDAPAPVYRTDPLDEYDFVYLQSNGVGRWVWKHFMRGTRSAQTFASREEAVNDAHRDAALQLRSRGMLAHRPAKGR